MADTTQPSHSHTDYTIACICPMGVELAPVEGMLDEIHDPLPVGRDQNAYTLGAIGGHNVVVAVMPEIGNNAAATVATQLLNDFPSIRFGLLVGIGGGVPGDVDVRLGDVVVSQPTDTFGGVVQYDMGKKVEGGRFQRTGLLNKPPSVLRANVRKLDAQHRRLGHRLSYYVAEMIRQYPAMQAEYSLPSTERDQLFATAYVHQPGPTCHQCDQQQTIVRPGRPNPEPRIHYGTIGSANAVVKDAALRDELQKDMHILCVEMEAAGLMNDFPCLVIRGICDYADSHKNKRWQPYAAAVAAAYMKELLLLVPATQVTQVTPAGQTVVIVPPTGTSRDVFNNAGGRQYNLTGPGTQFNVESMHVVEQKDDFSFANPRGLCLDRAPYIPRELFIGRHHELTRMRELLHPNETPHEQQRLVLGATGGMGKTQLAIAFAHRHRRSYSSIFWCNASSEATLQLSFQSVGEVIFDLENHRAVDLQQMVLHVRRWLSDMRNQNWLLIFDNHDEPQSYDIETYYPYASHGTIVVTTRRPEQVSGRKFLVPPLDDINQSLQILETRSQRANLTQDLDARQLAERLAGLPLALATAGAFLRADENNWTFAQYLDEYERRLDDFSSTELQDYRGRTLYTTWNISYARLEHEHHDAAQLLRLLAYFDNHDIWYELLRAGLSDEIPSWLQQTLAGLADFQRVIRRLVDFCFLEVQTPKAGSYSMHRCVHDWTLGELNRVIDPPLYWYAFDCVAASIDRDDWSVLGLLRYARISRHGVRLSHRRFEQCSELELGTYKRQSEAIWIAKMLQDQMQFVSAEQMYFRALAGYDGAPGRGQKSTHIALNGLGILYRKQDKLNDAEQMLQRALIKQEEVLGPDHTSTLDIVNNLGNVYHKQGKLNEAERWYKRALTGKEEALGCDHLSTLQTVNNLGSIYFFQGRLYEAEEMYERALAGKEKQLGPNHISILNAINNLGNVYTRQGKLDEAERYYKRALTGMEETLGPDHVSTLDTVNNIGLLCTQQGKSEAAEFWYKRALAGKEKILGSEHSSTLDIVYNIGLLYIQQKRFEEAECSYERVLAGREKILGIEHSTTLKAFDDLGTLYTQQGKLNEAEQIYKRALTERRRVLGPDDPSNSGLERSIADLTHKKSQLKDAEQRST